MTAALENIILDSLRRFKVAVYAAMQHDAIRSGDHLGDLSLEPGWAGQVSV
jgi:hypothetical protein